MPIINLKDEIYSEDMGKVISEEPDGNPGYVSDKLAEFWPFDISFSDDKITISFNITTDSPILTINNGKLSLVNDREDIDKSQYAYVYGDNGLGWYESGDVGLDRGVFGAGGDKVNTIDYIIISSLGNAQDFGDLTIGRGWGFGVSNSGFDRGIIGGGKDSNDNGLKSMEYITISVNCNANKFGDLHNSGYRLGVSNGYKSRGVVGIGGGYRDVFNIQSPSNATLASSIVAYSRGGITSNQANDRCVFGGGSGPNIYYFNITSLSNAEYFGALPERRYYGSATSNGINDRAVFGGGRLSDGSTWVNNIDYVTISTPSNSSDFGDLTVARSWGIGATSNGINNRGIFAGGGNGNYIDYINIASTGNAQDFGDLTYGRYRPEATSNA